MSPEEDEYVRTEAKPSWMATLAKAIIPASLIVIMGAGLLSWRNDAVFADRLSRLEREFIEFKKPGGRFTEDDGERHLSVINQNTLRVHELEMWRYAHTEWGRERTGEWTARLKGHEKRLDKLEQQR